MICTTAVPVMAAETDSEAHVLSEVMEEVQDEISGEDIEEPTQEETGMQEEAPGVTVQEEAQPEPSEPADEELPVFEEPVSEEPEVTDDALPDEEDQDAEEEPEEDYGIATLAVTNGFGQGSDGAWYLLYERADRHLGKQCHQGYGKRGDRLVVRGRWKGTDLLYRTGRLFEL